MRSQRWGSRAALYGMHKHCEHTACSLRHHHLNTVHTASQPRSAPGEASCSATHTRFWLRSARVLCTWCVPRTRAVTRGRCLLASWQSVTHLCRVGRLAPDPALCGGLHSQRSQLCVRSLACVWTQPVVIFCAIFAKYSKKKLAAAKMINSKCECKRNKDELMC